MSSFDSCDVRQYIRIPEFFCEGISEKTVVLPADGGNHFTHWGICEGTLLFVDLEKDYQEGQLSCFKNAQDNDEPKYKLSEVPLEGYEHLGRVVMTLRKFEDKNDTRKSVC